MWDNFWDMAYDIGAIGVDLLVQAVKTEKNPLGEISPEEFTKICGVPFEEAKAKYLDKKPKKETTPKKESGEEKKDEKTAKTIKEEVVTK